MALLLRMLLRRTALVAGTTSPSLRHSRHHSKSMREMLEMFMKENRLRKRALTSIAPDLGISIRFVLHFQTLPVQVHQCKVCWEDDFRMCRCEIPWVCGILKQQSRNVMYFTIECVSSVMYYKLYND